MTINKQNWRPDTCDCMIEMQFDTEHPEGNEQAPAQGKITHKCDAHTDYDNQTLLEELLGENQHKNLVINKAIETLGITPKEAFEQGKVGYSFDKDRKLSLELGDTVDEAKKAEIISALDADPKIDSEKGGRLKAVIATSEKLQVAKK